MATSTPGDESPDKMTAPGGVWVYGWMSTAKLRALFEAGLTNAEISQANKRDTGWPPSRSAVANKRAEMGFPPQRKSRKVARPWAVRPEHHGDMLERMLIAADKVGDGTAKERDRRMYARLHELLFGRGSLMVVNYHPEVGFCLVVREDGDEAFIRPPAHVGALRMDIQAALRGAQTDEELVAIAQRDHVRPEVLENFGRNAAADRLRSIRAAADREAPPAPAVDLGQVHRSGTRARRAAPGQPPRRARPS